MKRELSNQDACNQRVPFTRQQRAPNLSPGNRFIELSPVERMRSALHDALRASGVYSGLHQVYSSRRKYLSDTPLTSLSPPLLSVQHANVKTDFQLGLDCFLCCARKGDSNTHNPRRLPSIDAKDTLASSSAGIGFTALPPKLNAQHRFARRGFPLWTEPPFTPASRS